jgi:hypothetical protein
MPLLALGALVGCVLARRRCPPTPRRRYARSSDRLSVGIPVSLRVDLRTSRSSYRMKGILAALNQENPHGQQEHDLPLV